MGGNMSIAGGDFYTNMLQNQMNAYMAQNQFTNNGMTPSWAAYAPGGAYYNPNGGGAGQAAQAVKGLNLGNALVYGGIGAGAAGAGSYFTDNVLNSPVVEEKGVVKFTDDFMHHFSGEYKAMQDGDAMKNLFKELSTEQAGKFKFAVDEKNFGSIMEELGRYFDDPNAKLSEMSDDLKGFLKQRIGKDIVPSGTTVNDANRLMYEVVDSDRDAIRRIYAETLEKHAGIEFGNNYKLQRSLYESFDDIVKEMENCDTVAKKIEFLKSNPHAFGLNATDWEAVLKGEETGVNGVWSRISADTAGRKAALKSGYEGIERSMQGFAKYWKKNGFFGGKFDVFSKNTSSALKNALSHMKSSKALRHAGIAGAAIAAGTLLFNA